MRRHTPTQKQDPLNSYIQKISHIDCLLKRLQAACDDHFYTSPDDVTWGHVGTVADIEQKLQHLSDMVFHEGEYAPYNKA